MTLIRTKPPLLIIMCIMTYAIGIAKSSEEEHVMTDEEVCTQPKMVGPCRALIPRFYYNAETGECEEFFFGGCNENENNFKTKLACEARCKVSCRALPMDVVFIVDGSRSIRPHNFVLVKNFVKDIMRQFTLLGPKDTQVGLIQYGSRVRTEFPMNKYYDLESMSEAVDKIDYMEAGTMTGESLKFLVTKFYTKANGARLDDPTVMRLAIVITDGRSQDRTVDIWQKRAKNAGFVMYAIGVGRRTKESELLQIASEPKATHKFSVESFQAFNMLQVLIVEEICDIDECLFGNSTCNQICINTQGSYKCDCHRGYELMEDQSTCEKYDPCRDAKCTHICEESGLGVYRCLCKPGYKLMRDEFSCGDIDECELGHNCEQICINTEGSYQCDCNEGFKLREDGRTCESLRAPSPENLRFSDITHTSMRASWDIDNPALERLVDHYNVRYKTVDGQERLVQVKERSVELDGLDPETKYDVSVETVTMHDTSPPLQGSERTLELGETSLLLTNPTLTTLEASWEPADGDDLTGYTLRYRKAVGRGDAAAPEERVLEFGPETLTTTLVDLEPGTVYNANITPIHANSLPGSPGAAVGKTLDLVPPDVTVSKTSLSTANVEWTDVGMKEDGYVLRYYPTDAPEDIKEIAVPTGQQEQLVGGLSPDTKYMFDVVGHVTEGDKMFTSPVGSNTGTTMVLVPPDVTVSKTSLSTANVEWTDVGMKEDGFVLRYYPSDDPENGNKVDVPAGQQEQLVHGLSPDTEYTFEVTGDVTDNGEKFTSPVGSNIGTTGELVKPIVNIPNTTLTTMDVTWDDTNDSPLEYYTVRYCMKSDPENVKELTTKDRAVQLHDLDADTEYTVNVTANFYDDDQLFSTEPGTAEDSTKQLEAPVVDVSNPTLSTLTVEWGDVGDFHIDYFELSYYPQDEPEEVKIVKFEGDVRNAVLEGLNPLTDYEVTVVAHVTDDGKDMPSPKGIDSEQTSPLRSPVADVKDPTDSTAVVSWNDIGCDPVAFVIEYHPIENPENSQTTEVSGDRRTFILTDLEPDTEYEVNVYGYCEIGGRQFDSPTATDTGRTLEMPAPEVDANEPSISTIDVDWTDVAKPDDTYVLTYYPVDEPDDVKISSFPSDITSFTLVDLDPDTEYQVEVVVNTNRNGKEFVSEPGMDTETTSPLSAITVEADSPTTTSIDVRWSDIGTPADYYMLQYNPKGFPAQQKNMKVGGDTTSVVVEELFPNTKYTFMVTGHVFSSDDDEVFQSPTGKATNMTEPLPPIEVAVGDPTLTTLAVEWDRVDEAEKYILSYNPSGFPDNQQIIEFEADTTATILENLHPETTYDVSVTYEMTSGGESHRGPVGTDADTTLSLDPPFVELTNPTATTLQAEWTPVDGPISYYELLLTSDETGEVFKARVDEEDAYPTFQRLTPGTDYNISITAVVNEKIKSPEGTATGFTYPSPPKNPQVLLETPASVQVTFDPSDGGSEYYEAVCVPEGEEPSPEDTMVINKDDLTVTCEGLDPAVSYRVCIWTVYRSVKSEPIEIYARTILPPPQDLELGDPTTHSLLARWSPPPGVDNVEKYILHYGSSPDDGKEIIVPGHKTEVLLEDLFPDTNYNAMVAAVVNGRQSGPASDDEPTLADEIEIEVLDTTPTTITVQWTPSDVPSTQYYVLAYQANTPEPTPSKSIVVHKNNTIYVIRNVFPGIEYDISVVALYSNEGQSNKPETNATTPAPPPGPLRFTDIVEDGFVVHWTKPEDANPIGYTVTYSPQGFPEEVVQIDVGEDILGLPLRDLQPNNVYDVLVVANYPHNVTSEGVTGTEQTTDTPLQDDTCDCWSYLAAQNNMQVTLSKLVKQIEKLTEKVSELQGSKCTGSTDIEITAEGSRKKRWSRRHRNE